MDQPADNHTLLLRLLCIMMLLGLIAGVGIVASTRVGSAVSVRNGIEGGAAAGGVASEHTFWKPSHSSRSPDGVVIANGGAAVYFPGETAQFEVWHDPRTESAMPSVSAFIFLYNNEIRAWRGPYKSTRDCFTPALYVFVPILAPHIEGYHANKVQIPCHFSIPLPTDLAAGTYRVGWNVRQTSRGEPSHSYGAPEEDDKSIAYRYSSTQLDLKIVVRDDMELSIEYVHDIELFEDEDDCAQHIIAGAWQDSVGEGRYGMTDEDIACRAIAGAIGEVLFVADARAVVDCVQGECSLVALGGIAGEALMRKPRALWGGVKKFFRIGGKHESAFSNLVGKGFSKAHFYSVSHKIRKLDDLMKTSMYKAYDGDEAIQAGLRRIASGVQRNCVANAGKKTKNACLGYLRELQAATDFHRAGWRITGIQVPTGITRGAKTTADFSVRMADGTECLVEVRSAENAGPEYRSKHLAATKSKGLRCSMLWLAKKAGGSTLTQEALDLEYTGGLGIVDRFAKAASNGDGPVHVVVVARTIGGFNVLQRGAAP